MFKKLQNYWISSTKNEKYCQFFWIIYFLFSFFLLFINLKWSIKSGLVVLALGLFLFFLHFLSKKITNKKLKIIWWGILFSIPLLFRVFLLFLNYTNFTGDYIAYLNNSRSFANNGLVDSFYVSLFPHLYTFIVLIGSWFKLVGDNYINFVLLNIVIELVGAGLLYFLVKKKISKNEALKILLLYLYNPFNILWIPICCPVIIVNTLLIAILFCFNKIDFEKKNYVFISGFLGFLISISNSFRPVMIILIIALVIYYGYLLMKKEMIKKILISFVFILTVFLISNKVILIFIEKNIGKNLAGYQSGFSLLVGSNTLSNGMWNKDDSELFYELVENFGNIESHQMAKDLGIKRYIDNRWKNIKLLMYKISILGRNLDRYTNQEFLTQLDLTLNDVQINIINAYLQFYLYFLLGRNMLGAWSLLKRKRELDSLNIIGIFGMGLFVAMLLVEVSPRYFIPILIPILIIGIEKKNTLKNY